MSANSGSDGAAAEWATVPRDYRRNDPDPCHHAWDADRPVQEEPEK